MLNSWVCGVVVHELAMALLSHEILKYDVAIGGIEVLPSLATVQGPRCFRNL